MDKILKQITSDDFGTIYTGITDLATTWALCGFPDEANLLLEKLWSLNIEHNRNTRLNDEAFGMVWSLTGKAPLKVPFQRKQPQEIHSDHWQSNFTPYWNNNEAYAQRINGKDWQELSGNDLRLVGISMAYDSIAADKTSNTDMQLKSFQAISKYLKTEKPVGYDLMHSLLCAATLAARNHMHPETEELMIQWGENYQHFWSNTSIAYPLRDMELAKILLSGILAPVFNITKEICAQKLDLLSAALDERISRGQALAYESLTWQELLKRIAQKAVENGDYEGEADTLVRTAAGKKEIEAAEKRLNISLPREYKEFLSVSNGCEAFGLNPTLHDVSQIDWLKKLDPESVAIWTSSKGSIDKNFNEAFSKSLLIGGYQEEQQLLLIPSSQSKGWECWFFANWIPGETIYSDFRYFMEDVLQNLENASY